MAKRKPGTLLLVDDDPNLLALTQMLFSSDYDVVTARNGNAAWQILQTQPVDVVVTDLIMPGMNGAELAEKIKSDFPQKIPVILLTTATEMTHNLLRKGTVDAVVSKPCSVDELSSIISRAMPSKNK